MYICVFCLYGLSFENNKKWPEADSLSACAELAQGCGRGAMLVFWQMVANDCKCVCSTGSYVVLWRRGTVVLTAGNLMITRDPRFRLIDGHNLEIRNVMPQDAGDYVCSIGSAENKEQTHTLEILGELSLINRPFAPV